MSGFKVSAAASLCLAMASVAWAQGSPDEAPFGHLAIGNEPPAPSSFNPPEGWRPTYNGNGVIYYDAPDIPVGNCRIAAFPHRHLGGSDFRAWYDAQWKVLRAVSQEKGLGFEEEHWPQKPTKDGSDVLEIDATGVQFTAAHKGGWAQAFVYLHAGCGLDWADGAQALLNIGGGLAELPPLPKEAEELLTYSACMDRCRLTKQFLCTESYAGQCEDEYAACTSSC